MNLEKFAKAEYKRYCLAQGSQYIASEFALLEILKLIKNYNILYILEVGVGIGTISGSILKFARKNQFSVDVSATEANNFCLSQLPFNLGPDFKRLRCFNNLKSLPKNEKYDLIIIDGVEQDLKEIKEKLNPQGLVVIEGDRADQVKVIRKIFSGSKYIHLISGNRNGTYSVQNSGDYQGGLKLIFVNPNFYQFIQWIHLKVKFKIKYFKRKFLK